MDTGIIFSVIFEKILKPKKLKLKTQFAGLHYAKNLKQDL